MQREDILQMLADSVVNIDFEGVTKWTDTAVSAGIPAYDIVMRGLSEGMRVVGERFERKEYFIAELVAAGSAMKEALAKLKPLLASERAPVRGKVVIGTVYGDLHDLGKDTVAAMLASAGYEVYDLGFDVKADKFVEKVKEVGADIVALSALLMSTIGYFKEVIDALKAADLRERVKVIVGGRPVTAEFAEKIGADGYGEDASAAVRLAQALLKERR